MERFNLLPAAGDHLRLRRNGKQDHENQNNHCDSDFSIETSCRVGNVHSNDHPDLGGMQVSMHPGLILDGLDMDSL